MPIPLDDENWKRVTCKEARELSKRGYLVWWRPNMSAPSRQDPDSDPAWAIRVK